MSGTDFKNHFIGIKPFVSHIFAAQFMNVSISSIRFI